MLHITFRINLEMHAAQRIMKQNILVKPLDTMKPTSPAYIDKTIRFWIYINFELWHGNANMDHFVST